MNLQELSDKLNVSKATLSRVINNKPGVSEKKREEIKAFLAKNNLIKISDENNIVIIIPDFENPFFGEIIKEISKILREQGYQVTIYDTDENIENEKIVIRNIIKNGAAGVIFCVSNGMESVKNVMALQNAEIPIVLFDRELDFPLEGVFLNDFHAGFLATETLIKKGCKNIAVVPGSLELKNIKNRFEGYQYALGQYNLSFNSNLVFQGDMKIESGTTAMKNIVNSKIDIDGILILNNFMTIGVLNYINNNDSSLYDKYKILGFDIPDYLFKMTPKINIITRSRKEMGNLTANMILDKIQENKKEKYTKKIIIDPILY